MTHVRCMTFHSSISSPSFSDGNPLSSMIANGARAMSACCTSMGGRATCAFSGQFNAAIPSVTIAIAMLDWQEEDAPRKKASISFFRSFRSVRRDSRSTERLFEDYFLVTGSYQGGWMWRSLCAVPLKLLRELI